MPLSDLLLVDQTADLERALATLADLDEVGVDVERADWDRYYRAAALIQIGGAGRVVVVDPMSVTDLQALDAFLQERVSVFHAVENDLEPLISLSVKPTEMRDTAVAAAVLGLPTGLEGLLRDLLGVELSGDKAAMQRANWEARPLTPEMLDYAAGDVADLPQLWDVLAEQLVATGREAWYEQEFAAVLALPSVEDRRKWSRTKGAGRLDRLGRGRLRALWKVREDLGRDTDTAPGRIATDAVLVDLAENPPAAVGELGRRGVRRQAVREFGTALMTALRSVDPNDDEPRTAGRSPSEADRQLIEQLRQVRASRAKKLGIDAGVLCPSRILAPAVLADPATPDDLREALGLRPWQWEQLGAAFCGVVGVEGPGVPPVPEDPEEGQPSSSSEAIGPASSSSEAIGPASSSSEAIGPAMTDQLNPDALHKGLNELPGWEGTSEGISKSFPFADPDQARRFVERISTKADEVDHHPDVEINGADVTLSLVTHSAGGVTQKDLDFAALVESGDPHGDADPDNAAAGRGDERLES